MTFLTDVTQCGISPEKESTMMSFWFFGVVGSAVGKNGSQEGKLCWMPETVTIFERQGPRVHVGHEGERHRSQ